MFLYSNNLAALFLVLLVSGCSGGGGSDSDSDQNTQKSFDVNYTTVSALGSNVNNPSAVDVSPDISANGLELFFQSSRAGGSGSLDIWVSTRVTTTDVWGTATNLGATINSSATERGPEISGDGLTLIFASDRAGGWGGSDLYISTRATLNDAWSAPLGLSNVVNTTFTESGPSISEDGLSLYFFSDVPGGLGNQDLYVSTRATTLDPFGPPANLGATVNLSDEDSAPEISSDELTLYFHSSRAGGPGAYNIWRSTRASATDAWDAPTILPTPTNTTFNEFAPSLSSDWQTLYFSTDAGGSRGIWQAIP